MNTTHQITLAGVFTDYSAAETVARELKTAGFPDSDIHLTNDRETASWSGDRTQYEHEGGISGFFHRLFGSDHDSSYYEREVRGGRAVVTIDTDRDRMDQAIDIMNRNGAIAVDNPDAADRSNRFADTRTREGDQREGDRRIPIVEEELQVGKRVVNRGGVRIYSRVVERPVEEKVTLREDHVTVDRHPVDRPVSNAETGQLRDQTIEVLETAEEPVVNKRSRVVEEVAVGKNTTERTETIRDTVRRTEVNVENLDRPTRNTTAGVDDSEFRKDYETRYSHLGYGDYETYAPAYQYGYNAASDARYQGRSWSDVEADLQRDYTREHPNSTWENIRGAVRYGWEKITGRQSHA